MATEGREQSMDTRGVYTFYIKVTLTHTSYHTHAYTHAHACTHARTHTHMHRHARTHTHYIPNSHLSSDSSSKDLFTVTTFRRAAVTEGGMILGYSPLTVSFCSDVHFESLASTADGRGTACKEDGVTCMSCDTKYPKKISV